jgi:hypothetical protein
MRPLSTSAITSDNAYALGSVTFAAVLADMLDDVVKDVRGLLLRPIVTKSDWPAAISR